MGLADSPAQAFTQPTFERFAGTRCSSNRLRYSRKVVLFMFVQSLQANRVVNYSTGLSKVFRFGVENIQRRDKKQTEVTAVTLSCAPPHV